MKQHANRKRPMLGCIALALGATALTALFHPRGPSHARALAPPVAPSAAPHASIASNVVADGAALGRPAHDAVTGPGIARAGMMVAIDPRTGALVKPSPEQIRAATSGAAEVLRRTPEGLVEIRRSDGAVGLDLQGRFRDYAVVQVGPDGKPVFGCLHAGGSLAPTPRDSLPATPEERE